MLDLLLERLSEEIPARVRARAVLAVIQSAVLATPTLLATPTPTPPRKGEGR